jgi:hypothetical protein
MSAADLVLGLTTTQSSVPIGQSLPPGTELSLRVALPPSLASLGPGTTAAMTPSYTAAIAWALTASTGSTPVPLIDGTDYIIKEGSLTEDTLSIVFRPPTDAARSVTAIITPTVTISAIDATVIPPALATKTQDLPPLSFPLGVADSNVLSTAADAVADLLFVSADKLIAGPGQPVTIRVLPRKAPAIPQLATSILKEAPAVDIAGAIPLDNIVRAILAPMRATSSAFSENNTTGEVDDLAQDILRLLPDEFTLPIGLRISGERVATTLAPLGDALSVAFVKTPDESNDLTGFAPIGQWPMAFKLPGTISSGSTISGLSWKITLGGASGSADVGPADAESHPLGFIRSLLFGPNVWALGVQDPVSIKDAIATVKITPVIDFAGVAVPASIELALALTLLPLALPEIVVATYNDLLDPSAPLGKYVEVFVSRETATFAGSLPDLRALLGDVAAALNAVVGLLTALPRTVPPTNVTPLFGNLVQLSRALRRMNDVIARATAGSDNLRFYTADSATNSVATDDRDDWAISAFIAVAPRPITLGTGNGAPYLTIAPDTGAVPFLSTLVANLEGNWQDSFAVPTGSTTASKATDFNGQITSVSFTVASEQRSLAGVASDGDIKRRARSTPIGRS